MTTLSMLKIRAAIVVAALAIVPVSQALQAQGLTQLGKVTVPFAFEAGTAHFEPGVYTIIALMNSITLFQYKMSLKAGIDSSTR
jgi:hypothetical protein